MRAARIFPLVIYFLLCTTNNCDGIEKITDDGAWCWFSDPRAFSYNYKTYTGWVTRDGSIVAAAFDHVTHSIHEYILHEHLESNDHSNPSFCMLPDYRIAAFYSRHGDKHGIRMRKTTLPEDISSWEPEVILALHTTQEHDYCYTNPIILQSEGDRLYLFWRGLYWKPSFAWSDDLGETWEKVRMLVSSRTGHEWNRPYMKVASNGVDTIHFAFTDGHPRNEPTNGIYYMNYSKGTFWRADGRIIAPMAELPIQHKACDIVYDGRAEGGSWIWDIACEAQGYPVIVFATFQAENKHYYHYARWTGTAWQSSKICYAGTWFPETPQGQKEPEPFYSGGISLDHSDPSIVYLSRQIDNVFEIEQWTTGDSGITWQTEPVTNDSQHNNVRPVSVRNYNNVGSSVMWMNNNIYVTYKNYASSLIAQAQNS